MRPEAAVVFVAVCVGGLSFVPPPRRLISPPGSRPSPDDLRRWLSITIRRRRAARARQAALPLVLELTARELRSGATVVTALRRVAATHNDQPELSEVVDRIDRGDRVLTAIDRWVDAFHPADGALVSGVFHLGIETGSGVAGALDRAAAGIRARAELADEVRALTAQSRASAQMVALAPVGFAVVLSAAQPAALAFLVTSPEGALCLTVGLVLDAVGFRWMGRLVDGVAR